MTGPDQDPARDQAPDKARDQARDPPQAAGRGAFDPERSVLIAAIVFFLKAVGFVVVLAEALTHATSLGSRVLAALLLLGTVAAGIGLLRWKRWAWGLALCVLLVDATLVGGILRLLIDAGLLLLLVQTRVRSRFGMR